SLRCGRCERCSAEVAFGLKRVPGLPKSYPRAPAMQSDHDRHAGALGRPDLPSPTRRRIAARIADAPTHPRARQGTRNMTLILNNAEITSLLPMGDCLARLDDTYRDMGLGQAGNRPRSDIYGPVHDNGRYIFKTMDGMLPRFEVAAIRLNSDAIRWQHGPHWPRQDKQPTAGAGKVCRPNL